MWNLLTQLIQFTDQQISLKKALDAFQYKQCLCILTLPKYNEKFIDQISITYRPEEEKKNSLVIKEVYDNVETKNSFKYDYFPSFL